MQPIMAPKTPALRFVAYYRVSRESQRKSGLGLEAQQAAVAGFITGNAELVGRRGNDRNQRRRLR